MKNRGVTFLAAMGIPLSTATGVSGCTGVCGSCQLSCVPGVLAVIILGGKVLSRKTAAKRRAGYE